MHDWLGIGLFALGIGLAVAAFFKRRHRMQNPLPAGQVRPEFAAMGEIVRPLVLFGVGFIAFKASLFYFVFGGNRMITPVDYAGLMFVMAAYSGYLIAATTRPTENTREKPATESSRTTKQPWVRPAT